MTMSTREVRKSSRMSISAISQSSWSSLLPRQGMPIQEFWRYCYFQGVFALFPRKLEVCYKLVFWSTSVPWLSGKGDGAFQINIGAITGWEEGHDLWGIFGKLSIEMLRYYRRCFEIGRHTVSSTTCGEKKYLAVSWNSCCDFWSSIRRQSTLNVTFNRNNTVKRMHDNPSAWPMDLTGWWSPSCLEAASFSSHPTFLLSGFLNLCNHWTALWSVPLVSFCLS